MCPPPRAARRAASQPESRRVRITVRGGEEGPQFVDAMSVRVRAEQERRVGPAERLVVIRPVGEARVDYALTDAGADVSLAEVVRAQRHRHRVEVMFASGNGEAGLDHYEVRGWVGWHNHMTLSLMALRLLCLERRRLGGEIPGGDGAADQADRHASAADTGREPGSDRPCGDASIAA